MYKQKLCLGTGSMFEISTEEQIRLFKKVGFEAFFTMWDENVGKYKELADELDMVYQSVHAPFGNAAKMWESGTEAEEAVRELTACVRDCGSFGIPILIVHPYIGFNDTGKPTECGLANFGKIIVEAEKNNVKIAFENVEGEEYLKALFDKFGENENVGFCWDSGHEMCYNRGKDMLADYGRHLCATHINDNLGVRDFDGKITFIDDLHLLPGDGIINWENAVKRIKKCGFDGILTFELNKLGKPDRLENEKYARLSTEEYVTECYIRACRIANMLREI